MAVRARDESVADAVGGTFGPAEVETDREGDQPPSPRHKDRSRVFVAVGGERGDRAQGGGLGAGQEDSEAKQVGVGHGTESF